MNTVEPRLRFAYAAAGQEHVFHGLDRLAPADAARFLAELESVDLKLLGRLIAEHRAARPVATLDLDRLEPPRTVPVAATPGARRKEKRAAAAGAERLAAGRVAALIVAGGQGSRLGFEGPKGCFPIGPVSGCSLFEWHFKKVAAARARHGARVPLLVMTSEANHADTEAFLREHAWFGLPAEDVLLFEQGMLPAVDAAGRLLLAGPGRLFRSPDGHGGTLAALARSGLLDELERRGVDTLFYFQVDNPLVKVLDPAFLGHHALARSEMSSKVVEKRDVGEKVGVFAKSGRRLGVVEYSDLPHELAAARDPEGRLRFRAGNVAIHVIAVDFARRLTADGLALPYHRAEKSIPCLDEHGAPAARPGVKFETFVFDALPLAKRGLVVEALRSEEFSPVKNKEGDDSPASARRDLVALFRSWVEAAGWAAGDEAVLEVSPLFALEREEFVSRIRRERRLAVERAFIG